MSTNPSWILRSYPSAMPSVENWGLEDRPIPEAADGELLVKTLWLSVDPYMRGRISPAKNYAAGFKIGDLMYGGGIGEVITSEVPSLQARRRRDERSFWLAAVQRNPGLLSEVSDEYRRSDSVRAELSRYARSHRLFCAPPNSNTEGGGNGVDLGRVRSCGADCGTDRADQRARRSRCRGLRREIGMVQGTWISGRGQSSTLS